MPAISERAVELPASPIRRLVPSADIARKKGLRVYHLNIGQPDIESPEEFWQAVRQLASSTKVLEYSNSAGREELRRLQAEHYRSIGIEVSPTELLVTTGGSEALFFALLACLNPGDEVIFREPCYANYISFAVELGLRVKPIVTRIEDDFALPEPEEFERQITPHTKAILICNPDNPTGGVYDDAMMRDLRDICLRHDLFLIGDEVYREFNYTPQPLTSVLQLEGMEEHAVMCDSVSKRFSLCGARVGFIVSRNADVISAALKCGQARLSSPTLEMMAVERTMSTPAAYFEAVRAEYKRRQEFLVRTLRSIPGVVCPRLDGAFYAMVRLPVDDTDRFCQWMLEEFEHEGQTVMLAPGSGFYATPGLGTNEARIAYVLNEQDLSAALECLRHALARYPGRVEPTGRVGVSA
jgi:aspartate aminotransferase